MYYNARDYMEGNITQLNSYRNQIMYTIACYKEYTWKYLIYIPWACIGKY